MKISRRHLLQSAAGLGLTASFPSKAANDSERKFLFVFCEGGWDQCHLFAPLWSNPNIDMEEGSELGHIGGIDFVDSAAKPSVREFLNQYASRTCFINGLGVRSLAHETCLRLMYAGTANPSCNDWASMIGGHARGNYLMPMVTLSGPNFVLDYTSAVSRVGANAQLADLFDPEVFTQGSVDEMEDSWLQELNNAQTSHGSRHEHLRNLAIRSEEALQSIQNLRHTLDFSFADDPLAANSLYQDLSIAISLLRSGTSRCVSLKDKGWQGLGYDTHAANYIQASNIQSLFDALYTLYRNLEISDPQLYDNLTIVMLSEMGRFPKINSRDGKTHWMHTSAILIGSGVQGGQCIGAYDNDCYSQPVVPTTGEIHSSGTYLLPSNLGATLMHLADVDMPENLLDYEPLWTALS